MSAIVHAAAKAGNLGSLSPEDRARYERSEARTIANQRSVRIKHCRDGANVPSIYARAVLGEVSGLAAADPIYVKTCEWLRRMVEFPRTAALVGDYRTGKTRAACGLINAFIEQGRTARYVKVLHLFAELVSTRSTASRETLAGLIKRYRSYDLVVFDEITVRTDSPFDAMIFRDLLDERHNNLKSTLLLGNTPLENLAEIIGDSVVARMNETGGVLPVKWKPLSFKGAAHA